MNKQFLNFIFLIVVLALAGTAFTIVYWKRVNDADAGKQVENEGEMLILVANKIRQALVVEQSNSLQKNVSSHLLTGCQDTKALVSQTSYDLVMVDTLTDLAISVNMTIEELAQIYLDQITALELALKVELGTADNQTTVMIQNGTCMLQGDTALQITYSYHNMLDNYFYYKFGTTPGSIEISQNFTIRDCAPPLYVGPTPGTATPVYTVQLTKLGGSGAQYVAGLEAGDNRLNFETRPFVGTQQVSINEPLTHFVSFY